MLQVARTKPYRPRTNGKAERFIQTMLREWAHASGAHGALNDAAPTLRAIQVNNLVRLDS